MKFGLVVLVTMLGLGHVAHAFTAEALLGLAVFAKVNLVIGGRKQCFYTCKNLFEGRHHHCIRL